MRCAALHCAQLMYSVQCASVWSELLLLYKPCCTACPIPLRVRACAACRCPVIAVFTRVIWIGHRRARRLAYRERLRRRLLLLHAANAHVARPVEPTWKEHESTNKKLQLYRCADTVARPPPSFPPTPSSSFRPCLCGARGADARGLQPNYGVRSYMPCVCAPRHMRYCTLLMYFTTPTPITRTLRMMYILHVHGYGTAQAESLPLINQSRQVSNNNQQQQSV
jgi:hypothetical protein